MTEKEKTYFDGLSKDYMTEESDADSSDEIVLHKHPWRSQSKLKKSLIIICICEYLFTLFRAQ